MGCSVGFKYAKNALAAGELPRTPLGELTKLPYTSYSGGRKGGKGPYPPKPWIKKLKLSCRIMHIDAMAVAVINDHKTAHKHSSFAPFQAYHNIKKCSVSEGLCPPDPLTRGSALDPTGGTALRPPL